MKSLVKYGAMGFTGIVLFKVVAMPLLGMVMGLLFLTLKFALAAAVVYVVYSFIKGKRDGDDFEDIVDDIVEDVEDIIEDIEVVIDPEE